MSAAPSPAASLREQIAGLLKTGPLYAGESGGWNEAIHAVLALPALREAAAHRVVCSEEHDPLRSLYHGACATCGEAWPCSTERALQEARLRAAVPAQVDALAPYAVAALEKAVPILRAAITDETGTADTLAVLAAALRARSASPAPAIPAEVLAELFNDSLPLGCVEKNIATPSENARVVALIDALRVALRPLAAASPAPTQPEGTK